MKVIVIIPAAGLGTRMSAVSPGAKSKQFFELKGTPILFHTIRKFAQNSGIGEIVIALRKLAPGIPFVQGGRSNGARVACRTAAAVGARAVIALAFPLRPPGGADAPRPTRVGELRAARASGVAVLAVSGERDPFGIPDSGDADRIVIVPRETHALKGHRAEIAEAVARWLPTVL